MIIRHHKRLCFSPDSGWVKEYIKSLAKPVDKVTFDTLGIQNMEMFKNITYAFVIIDIKHQLDITTLKNHLKKLPNKTKQTDLIENILESKTKQPLEKIFKMIPQKDNLVEIKQNYKRFVMTLELNNTDDTILNTYKHVHKPDQVWPEIINNMKTIGVKDMELYLDGYQVFLLMDTNLDFDMEKDGERWSNLPREKEWQNYVARFQKVDPKSKATEKWKLMKLIN